jgi:hypothetical protein
MQEVLTAPDALWQNAYVEWFIDSVRRECLDHVIVLRAAGLRRLLKEYVSTTPHRARTWRSRRTHPCHVRSHPRPQAV